MWAGWAFDIAAECADRRLRQVKAVDDERLKARCWRYCARGDLVFRAWGPVPLRMVLKERSPGAELKASSCA